MIEETAVKEVREIKVSMDTLNETIKTKEEKLKGLEIREQNIENQIHSLEVKKVQAERIDSSKTEVRLLEGRNKIELERNKLKTFEDALKVRESELERRFTDLETREKEIVGINKLHAKLNEERVNFNHYKFNIERELQEAKIVIAEAKVSEDKLKGIQTDIEGEKVRLEQEREEYYDRVGELEVKEKNHKAEVEQFNGLKQHKEVV